MYICNYIARVYGLNESRGPNNDPLHLRHKASDLSLMIALATLCSNIKKSRSKKPNSKILDNFLR